MKPLVDLTSRALARMIEGKSPEEIRATFNLPDDLTEEEKLEPLKSGLADARIKLLNKLYAKKRQARPSACAIIWLTACAFDDVGECVLAKLFRMCATVGLPEC